MKLKQLIVTFLLLISSITYSQNFVKVKASRPKITTLSPLDDAIHVSTNSNLTLTFDENVNLGTGDILIYDADNDTTPVQTIAITTANVSITNAVVTINPIVNFSIDKSYYIQIEASAFKNDNNTDFRGITDKITWSFTTAPKAGTATHLNFDGIDDAIDIGDSLNTTLESINTFTVEALVKSTTDSGNGVIVGNYANNDGNQMQFLLRRDGNYYTFWIKYRSDVRPNSDFIKVGATSTVSLNTWQHVAGTWDGTNIKIYIDGVLENTVSASGTGFISSTNNILMGNNVNNESFSGDIDEVRIWNKTRTQAEIDADKNQEVDASDVNLLAYYQFNQGEHAADNTTITTLVDNSTNNYNGTLTNFALSGTSSNWITDVPEISTLSPADDAIQVAFNSDLTLIFDENVNLGTGDILIYDADNDTTPVQTIAITTANVSITDAVVTINPTADFSIDKSYYVQIGATAFKNDSDNYFAGIADKTTWSFAAVRTPVTWYVDINVNTTATPDGTAWANAYKTVSAAITNAVSGDEILIAQGTYQESSTITLDQNLAIKGGYPTGGGTQNFATYPTILDGEEEYQVINNTSNSSIDGLTIQNGKANLGGGMLNKSSSPSLSNITFTNNKTFGSQISSGGGMCNVSSNPTLSNVTFNSNESSAGGGMCNYSSNPTLSNVTFTSNKVAIGGGMYNSSSNPTLNNVTFNSNNASFKGGGMYNVSSNPTLNNVTFNSNNTSSKGGGMFNDSSNPTLSNVTFTGNTATSNGGGLYNESSSNPKIYNSVFYNNTANNDIDDVYNQDIPDNSNSLKIIDTTGGLNTISLLLKSGTTSDTIISEPTGVKNASVNRLNDDINDVFIGSNISTPTGANNASDGTNAPQTNGDLIFLTTDPFTDSTNPAGTDGVFGTADDGLLPVASSVLINAGDNTKNSETLDLAGNTRVYNTTIDIGAYEYHTPITLNTTAILENINTVTIYKTANNTLVVTGLSDATNIGVYSLKGKQLLQSTITTTETNFNIAIPAISSGIYIVKINTANGVIIKKVVL